MLIYIAHPYGGKEQNKQEVARIIDYLIGKYPEHNWLSPIHATGNWYHSVDYDRGMEWCLSLLEKCDEMWVFGDFWSSKGCKIEINWCLDNNKRYWVKQIPPEVLLGNGEPKRQASEPAMDRAAILDTARQCICTDRNNQYGPPEDSFRAIANLWDTYLKQKESKDITPEDVALLMSLMKIARIQTGSYKADSYVDACGYIAIAGELGTGKKHSREMPRPLAPLKLCLK